MDNVCAGKERKAFNMSQRPRLSSVKISGFLLPRGGICHPMPPHGSGLVWALPLLPPHSVGILGGQWSKDWTSILFAILDMHAICL